MERLQQSPAREHPRMLGLIRSLFRPARPKGGCAASLAAPANRSETLFGCDLHSRGFAPCHVIHKRRRGSLPDMSAEAVFSFRPLAGLPKDKAASRKK